MNNNHYRYCFHCNKWKTKEQINEIDYGDNRKGYHCNVCRKDLGDQIQIFTCHNHENIILKVWGTLEGQNKEKIFHKNCPMENRQEETPPKTPPASKWDVGVKIVTILMLTLILVLIGFGVVKVGKKSKKKRYDKFFCDCDREEE